MSLAPDDTQRLFIMGRTGSGKTQAAAWHLSRRGFNRMPWIIFDYKLDAMLNSFAATEIALNKAPPTKPGLYIIHPQPGSDDDAVEKYLWKIWANGKTGVYVDEGYMMGTDNPAFRAMLTQGRSKRIPMIYLSQRPVWMDRFAISEADFYQVFHLNDFRDRQTIQAFTDYDLEQHLPAYHSVWCDVGENTTKVLRPVKDRAEIIAAIKAKLPNRKGYL